MALHLAVQNLRANFTSFNALSFGGLQANQKLPEALNTLMAHSPEETRLITRAYRIIKDLNNDITPELFIKQFTIKDCIQFIACYDDVPLQLSEEVHENDYSFKEWSGRRSREVANLSEKSIAERDVALQKLTNELKRERIQALLGSHDQNLFNFFKTEIKSLQNYFNAIQLEEYFQEIKLINDKFPKNFKKIPIPEASSQAKNRENWENRLTLCSNKKQAKINISYLFNDILNNHSLDEEVKLIYFKKTIYLLLQHLFGPDSLYNTSAATWIAAITNAMPHIVPNRKASKKVIKLNNSAASNKTILLTFVQSFKNIQFLHRTLYANAIDYSFDINTETIPDIDLKKMNTPEAWNIFITSLGEFNNVSPQLVFFYNQFAWNILDQYIAQENADLQLCLTVNEALFLRPHYFGTSPIFFEMCESRYITLYHKIAAKLKPQPIDEIRYNILTRANQFDLPHSDPVRILQRDLLFQCNTSGHLPLMQWAYEQLRKHIFNGNDFETVLFLSSPSLLLEQSDTNDASSLIYIVSNCLHQFSVLCAILASGMNIKALQKTNLLKSLNESARIWIKRGFEKSDFNILQDIFGSLAQLLHLPNYELRKRVNLLLERISLKCIEENQKSSLHMKKQEVLSFSLLVLNFRKSQGNLNETTFNLWLSMRRSYRRILNTTENEEGFIELSSLLIRSIHPDSDHQNLFENNKHLFRDFLQKEGQIMAALLNRSHWAEYVAAIHEHNAGILRHNQVDISKWITPIKYSE